MSVDRVKGIVVAFDHDIPAPNVETIMTTLRWIQGVASVEPIGAEPMNDMVSRMRVDNEWRQRIYKLLEEGK